ncbi:GTP-binding protein [Patescibacteria group bacterium]|nr:GTP-binding protein [Patescibacteria group bacterium]MBU1500803.1 GTP-binding protein [Patescibacteria group bacterium]MBU2080858.1 GTP-binding protein [Patescibacteria group bacterium]MBU2123963.1 GTP-binding protein [Patescibacteria group bacterium]MBU2194746.1 GTP-binding protein [Patescibacteria group bacterium]
MERTTRPPIVAVMGHIDHGKSSLLDYIRKTNVTADEAGGITQHVSAYEASHEYEGDVRRITFLDTPGHEAFRALRARGAQAADIAILVIAAEEGVKPQTLEAFEAITEAGTPFVVAFTKIDKSGADVEKAKVSALENGIYLEGLGGSVAYTGVSSKSGDGIPELLDLVLLTADLAELTADTSGLATGYVLESSQDPKRGMSATLIVKDGTMETGSFAVAGTAIAPIRFIEDFSGARIQTATASQPVRISGWSGLPPAGTPFVVAKTKKDAEKLAAEAEQAPLRAQAEATETGVVTLPLVVKTDVTGSVLAIKHELAKITHERVVIRIIQEGIGAVSENDMKVAQASGGTVIAFNVGTDSAARDFAERTGIEIGTFTIIYELKEHVERLVAARAPRVTVEEILGEAKVLKAFNTSGTKQVLGGRWISGVLSVGDTVKIDRRGIHVGNAKLVNLQVARVDVSEIKMEGEFGMQVEGRYEAAGGDTLIAFKMTETK